MSPPFVRRIFILFSLTTTIIAQIAATADDGYTGYNLAFEGDKRDVVYETANTASNVSSLTSPDVFLNASVSVGEIDITVSNLTAKVNLDAQVLSLLSFNAGVKASIDRVSLLIQNVSAKVTLEVRLANLVTIISDVLDSIDLNPVIATLGNDVGQILNTTTTGVTSVISARSSDLEYGVLYSVNDYSGNTHTNRVLTQSGSIVDEFLNNDGVIHSQKTVGNYFTDMTFNGHNSSAIFAGRPVFELEYIYTPFLGSSSVCAIYVDVTGVVVGTQVLSESSAGGSSTISDE